MANAKRRNARSITESAARERLCTNVRMFRRASAISIEQAAERAEMDRLRWQQIESGELTITLRTLVHLGDALGVDPADLLRSPGRRSRSKDPTHD